MRLIERNEEEWCRFCANLKFLKDKHGLSDRRMAQMLCIGNASLKKLLQGEIPPRMSIRVVLDAADGFGYHPADLFSPIT